MIKRYKLLANAIKNGKDSYTLNGKEYSINKFDRFFSGKAHCFCAAIGGLILAYTIPSVNTDEIYEPRIDFSFNLETVACFCISTLMSIVIVLLIYDLYCRIFTKQ